MRKDKTRKLRISGLFISPPLFPGPPIYVKVKNDIKKYNNSLLKNVKKNKPRE